MTLGYTHLKNWRHRTKERIILSMGGCCALCGYNKCPSALALHHLDPAEKDFNFSNQSGTTPKNWSRLVVELRKCILLCHNCHCEVHSKVRIIPDNVSRFNEQFTSYEPLRSKKMNACPICNTLKPIDMKSCSRECSSKMIRKINWDAIDLLEELKHQSILSLSKQLGCSDVAIHKRMKKLGLKRSVEQRGVEPQAHRLSGVTGQPDRLARI